MLRQYQRLFIPAFGGLLLIVAVPPATANDVDVKDATGFGALVKNLNADVNVSGLGPTGDDPLLFTFYAQSLLGPGSPDISDFSGNGGGTTISGIVLVPTPTPEPASLSLLATGVGLLAAARLWRQRHRTE